MTLLLYNSLTRKKEEFAPSKDNTVRWYTCGPTVYDYAHIGNFRAYVWEDVLRRYYEYKGWKVNQVMNLTDVDDKTIKGSQAQKIPLEQYTEKYSKAFFEDLKSLNIEPAEHYPKATTHIPEMVELTKKLLAKGIAYKSPDGSIYFSVAKFAQYGKLSHTKLENLKQGARVSQDNYEKQSAGDFALWKAWDEKDGEVYWDTQIGKGRPGWHLECSAMATKYLGETLDAHAGGIDLTFPHHENEIAQSEGATGKPFSRFWLHCEHLLVDGRKMSKSLGNFFTLRQVLEKGNTPAGVRWLLISAQYRQQLNFTFEALKSAQETVEKLSEFIERMQAIKATKDCGQATQITEKAEKDFETAMDDDLNTPHAIAALFELVRQANKLENQLSHKEAQSIIFTVKKLDKVLGILEIAPKHHATDELTQFVQEKLAQRDSARAAKDYAKSDEIRKQLAAKGVTIQDTPKGTTWKKQD